MSITKNNSTNSTPKISRAPRWINDIRVSLDHRRRLQQRLDQSDQLEHLTRARDAMIDAVARRKSVEKQMTVLQQQKADLQQQMTMLQQQMTVLQQQKADLQQRKAELREQMTHPGGNGELTSVESALLALRGPSKKLDAQWDVLRAEDGSLQSKEATWLGEKISLMVEEEQRTHEYVRLRTNAEASQAEVERFEAARADAINELTTSGVLDGMSGQPDYEVQQIWLELQAEEFIVWSGGLLDRIWMVLQSLFMPTVPIASILVAASAEDPADTVLQLYQWERNRLLTLAKGAGGAAATVIAGLIATGFARKAGVNSITLFVVAPLVAILLLWAGFLLTGLRGLADQYTIARELVER
ncbi:MAG TPA: hypothetical protein VGH77_18150 [Streptosporangiaceae bacterium]